MKNESILYEVLRELERAEEIHPEWPTNMYERLAILTEEVGELSQAILQHDHENMPNGRIKDEAVQVAAMAIRFLKHLEY